MLVVERDVAQVRCPIEYKAKFGRICAKDLSEEEVAALAKAKKELEQEYEAMHKEEALTYRPGETANAMKKAREEFSDRVSCSCCSFSAPEG
ncbi:MAG TPA: hypothetical protein VGO47_10220 [Chlamydiales bacterium]|nr:hypothetical protein [Chlamydiales bacterium]